MNITEAEIGQGKGHSQGIMVTIGIEVPVTVDQVLDLELVLIGIEYGVTIAGQDSPTQNYRSPLKIMNGRVRHHCILTFRFQNRWARQK